MTRRNLAEISASEDYLGERLIVCRNLLVGAERSRKRSELLDATKASLKSSPSGSEAGSLAGAAEIGLAVGLALKRHKLKKHFEVAITDSNFTFSRRSEQIEAEVALDGFYVLRTSVPEDELAADEVVRSYKGLEQVERAFGTLKGPELEIRRSPPPRGPRPRPRLPLHAARAALSPESLCAQERAMAAWHAEEQPRLEQSASPPALIAHGGADVVIPVANARALMATRSASRVELFEGCGHAFIAQESERAADLLGSFLAA